MAKCRICGNCECYEHCPNAVDGKHVPNPYTVNAQEDQDCHGGMMVFDIECELCGLSGSVTVDPKDVVFE